MRTVAADEGISALYNGLIPALHRQWVFAGLRIGLYDTVSLLRIY